MVCTAKEIQNNANVKTLRKIREFKKISRKELASRLGVSFKAIEKYENGREFVSEKRLKRIIEALEINENQFLQFKRGKGFSTGEKRKKNVLTNSDRRSYQRNITKECRVLKSIRRLKNLSQAEAAKLTGLSRQAIGHMENGRVEITNSRVIHIFKSYGCSVESFKQMMEKEQQYDEVLDDCIGIINELSEDKLRLVKSLLDGFAS